MSGVGPVRSASLRTEVKDVVARFAHERLLRPRLHRQACARMTSGCVWPSLLDTMVCSAFGLQALQDIEPRQRPTGLLDQPAIAQIA